MALLLALPLGCGSGDRASTDARPSLLRRLPDRVTEEPGLLDPDPREQWGELGGKGWSGHTYSLEGGKRLAVWTRRPRATLDLPAVSAEERHLVLHLGASGLEAASLPVRTTVELNGIGLGTFEVTEAFREVRLEPPASTWRRGSNELALVVDRLRAHGDGSTYGVALSGVAWGTSRLAGIDPDRGEVVLPKGTAVTYRVERRAAKSALLQGDAPASGELRILCREVDPVTGDTRETELGRSVQLPGGPFSLPIQLPETALLELGVGWDGAEAPLTLTEFEVLGEATPPPPTILLICLDTMAAENLSLYGYERETTPNLERLASESIVFDRCVTNAPWTMPSVFSFMTGLYPSSHRLPVVPSRQVEPQPWEQWYLAPNRWTLAESLRAAGYRTAGFVEHLWLTPRYGFTQGFDVYDFSACEIDKTDPSGGLRYVSERARTWLDVEPTAPAFLFLHAYDIHGPYSPSPPWRGTFRDDRLAQDPTLLPSGAMHNVFGAVPAYISEAEYDHPQAEVSRARLRAAYDEGVLEADAVLGEWLTRLEEDSFLDRAIVIVTSDHGETMGEGPYYFGHGVLEESVLHVPLLIRLPGGEHGGRRVTTPVQLVDLYPTLLELAGLEPRGRGLHGRSLVPALRGEDIPPEPVFSETGIMQQAAIESGGWRLRLRSPGLGSADEVLLTYPGVPASWRQAHLPAAGNAPMTSDLLARLRAQPDFGAEITSLRARMSEPEVDLRSTNKADAPNVASRRPKQVSKLRGLLAEQAHRAEQAREAARPKVDAVHLSPEAVRDLEKLGYADSQD